MPAKVDPGAAVCLFKREHGEELGVPVEQGVPIKLDSIGGSLEAFGHEVVLQTGDLVFESVVYFAKYPNLPRNLLGRQGWLRNLCLALIYYDNLLYLNGDDIRTAVKANDDDRFLVSPFERRRRAERYRIVAGNHAFDVGLAL